MTVSESDDELISRIRDGDTHALDMLVDKYLPIIYGWVRRFVSIEDVEDVTQDVFLGLVRYVHTFEGKSTFRTWFWQIVHKRIADHHRKKFRLERNAGRYESRCLELSASLSPETGGLRPLDEDYQLCVMADMLNLLPEHYREILLMRFYQGMTFVEIASELGMAYDGARSRYRLAIKCARKKLSAEFSDISGVW